jgi:hypothetical protein
MARTTQLSLRLKSKPGVLASLTRALADAGVNITALSTDGTAGRGQIRMLVNNPVKAKRALRKARYRFTEEPAFVVRLQNKPGALARVTARLAKARVNIKSSYATTTGRGSSAVVFTVGSVKKARKVLR